MRHRFPAHRALRVPAALALCVAAACAPAGAASGPTPEQIPALEAEAARRPADTGAAARLAAAYRAANRLGDARATLERALQRDGRDPRAILLLGLTLEDQEEFAEARRLYERYLEVGRDRGLRASLTNRLALVRRRELAKAVRESLARESTLRNTAPQPRTVAVFPFQYTGDDESLRPLGRALAEMLTTDLSQTTRLSVLERLQVQMLLDEMQLAQGGLADPATAVRSGQLLGAERVVQGALAGSQEAVALDAAIVRVGASQDAPLESRTVSERDALARLLDAEKRLALSIYEQLGVQLTPAERQRVNQRATDNVQALLAYGMGLEAADAGNHEQATQHFQRAVQIDPGFSAARQAGEQSSEIAAAEQVTTQQLAQDASVEGATMLDPVLAVEALIPSVTRRDAASESLGQEGLGQRRTILEIIIRRP